MEKIKDLWTHISLPKKGEFVLVTNSPYQDNETEIKRGKDKIELIDIGERLISDFYSSIRIYNDAKLIVWDAFLPTTLLPNKEKYDPEYFKTLIKE